MSPHELDNPVWNALRSRHAGFAQRAGHLARYPADVAPFIAVEREGEPAGEALDALVAPGEVAYALGVAPSVPAHWHLDAPVPLVQMVSHAVIDVVDAHGIVELDGGHAHDVLALTALVYPHYFRTRTTSLGRYFGIFENGRLAAMIGERMASDAWQEVSAICTHPEHLGRGHARRLLAWLSNDIHAQGRTPFLHVSPRNTRAVDLYARTGYVVRREIGFSAVRRVAD